MAARGASEPQEALEAWLAPLLQELSLLRGEDLAAVVTDVEAVASEARGQAAAACANGLGGASPAVVSNGAAAEDAAAGIASQEPAAGAVEDLREVLRKLSRCSVPLVAAAKLVKARALPATLEALPAPEALRMFSESLEAVLLAPLRGQRDEQSAQDAALYEDLSCLEALDGPAGEAARRVAARTHRLRDELRQARRELLCTTRDLGRLRVGWELAAGRTRRSELLAARRAAAAAAAAASAVAAASSMAAGAAGSTGTGALPHSFAPAPGEESRAAAVLPSVFGLVPPPTASSSLFTAGDAVPFASNGYPPAARRPRVGRANAEVSGGGADGAFASGASFRDATGAASSASAGGVVRWRCSICGLSMDDHERARRHCATAHGAQPCEPLEVVRPVPAASSCGGAVGSMAAPTLGASTVAPSALFSASSVMPPIAPIFGLLGGGTAAATAPPPAFGQAFGGQAFGGHAFGGQAFGGQASGGQASGGQAFCSQVFGGAPAPAASTAPPEEQARRIKLFSPSAGREDSDPEL